MSVASIELEHFFEMVDAEVETGQLSTELAAVAKATAAELRGAPTPPSGTRT